MTPSRRKLDRKGHFLGASERLERGAGEPAGAGPSPGLGVGSAEVPAGLLGSDALCPEVGIFQTHGATHLVLGCLVRHKEAWRVCALLASGRTFVQAQGNCPMSCQLPG